MGRIYHAECRHFTGYRPCRYHRACTGCPYHDPVRKEILVINLDGMGDVLRSTAILPNLKRVHPRARITWLTLPRAAPLLAGHPDIDEILPLDFQSVVHLEARSFDLLLNVDKARVSGALAMRIPARERRGFGIDEHGVIVPLNPDAAWLYETGLDDDLKFRNNAMSEPEMLAGALGLPWQGDRYRLYLRDDERRGPPRKVGFNTGCNPAFRYKHLHPVVQEAAIRLIHEAIGEPVLLLGGPEDTERNRDLAGQLGAAAELSPTDAGLREGAAQVDRCEVVVTGDSLGMHMAIALGKHVVVWFGPTCPQEIHVYGRGIRLLADVECAPCWLKDCERRPKCNERVAPEMIRDAVLDSLEARTEGRPLDQYCGSSWYRPIPE